MSGGNLCEAEAPTEPAGETAVRCAAIRLLPLSSLRSRANGCGNPFSFEGNTDFFTLRVQNDRNLVIAKVRVSGGHLCGAEAPTEPAGETQNGCGNPFSFEGNTDSFTLCVQNDKKFSHCEGQSPAAIRSFSRGIRILSRFAFRMTEI